MNKALQPARTQHSAEPRIDGDSFEPPYFQLAGILRQQSAAGHLRPGDRVPSEIQICERYEVSPMTARRAINILLGGQIDEQVSKYLGADCRSTDAMEGVRFCQELLNRK